MKGQRGNPGLKGRLVDKSVEAYILALETINRLSVQYRVETFCYLICNAWELLLKAKIIEVPKDPSKSHPFRQKEVIEKVKTAVTGLQINQHDIQCVNKVHGIKQRPEYFYQGKVKGSPAQYSPAFVDWLVKQFQRDQQFFQKTKTKAKGKV